MSGTQTPTGRSKRPLQPLHPSECADFAEFEAQAADCHVGKDLKPFPTTSKASAMVPIKRLEPLGLSAPPSTTEVALPSPLVAPPVPTPDAPLAGISKAKSVKFSPSKARRQSRASAQAGTTTLILRTEPDTPIASGVVLEADADLGPCRATAITARPVVAAGTFSVAIRARGAFISKWCLEPPLGVDDVPQEEWYCKACQSKSGSTSRAPKSGLFAQLIAKANDDVPKTFKLPLYIRTEFKDVATDDQGDYYNTAIIKPPRVNKAGFIEWTDPFAMKDHKNKPRYCHQCRRLPSASENKAMVSCDYCDLHWHFDCLEPPLISLPPTSKRWKCPLHADWDMPVVRKTKPPSTVHVKDRNEANNGNVTVLPRHTPPKQPMPRYDEILYRNIRYQVPEETLILDFWAKVRGGKTVRHKRAESKNRLAKQLGLQGGDESDSSLSSLDSLDSSPELSKRSLPTNPRKGTLRGTKGASASPAISDDVLPDMPASAVPNGFPRAPLPPPQSALLPKPHKSGVRQSKRLKKLPEEDAAPPPPNASTSESPLKVRLALPPSKRKKGYHYVEPEADPTVATFHIIPPAQDDLSRTPTPSVPDSPSSSAPSNGRPPAVSVDSKDDLLTLSKMRKLAREQSYSSQKDEVTSFLFAEAPAVPNLSYIGQGTQKEAWSRPWDDKQSDDVPEPPQPQEAPAVEAPVPAQ